MVRRIALTVGVAVLALSGCGGSSTLDGSGGTGASSAGGGTGGTAATGGGGTGGTAAIGGGGTGGVPDDWTSCKVPTDCILRSVSCCGACGAATRDDSIALNQTGAQQYTSKNCDGVGCPACYMPTDPTLLATCRGGSCVVVDLQKHDSTACKDASECRLRTNACCECGGPIDDEHLIAIGNGGGFDALVCDPGTGCPECAPLYPPAKFLCEDGHCAIDKN